MLLTSTFYALLAFTCMFTALLATALAAILARRRTGVWITPAAPSDPHGTAPPTEIGFLLRGGVLSEATQDARDLLADHPVEGGDWDRILRALGPRFPGFPGSVPPEGHHRCDSALEGDDGKVDIEVKADVVRILLTEGRQPAPADVHRLACARLSVERCETALENAPFPIWTTDARQGHGWANSAFHDLREACGADPRDQLESLPPVAPGETPRTTRLALDMPETAEGRWFDVAAVDVNVARLFYAIDMTPVVRAEIAQRDFVQTLTKTFALLRIGLAIFDRDRRLTLFNPALIDLTALGPDFLSGRPPLASFFDALRERQVMPEPKNYIGWRETISDRADRAADGNFEETWSLPVDQTYRVTGQPYPNGAVAFLFEDISAEIQMSRRFHRHLLLGQSVLDSLDEAIIVFSRSGRVTDWNRAYRELLGLGEEDVRDDLTVRDVTRQWEQAIAPDPLWGDLRDFVTALGPRCEWAADLRAGDGRVLACRIAPLSDGATLVGFRVTEEPESRSRPAAE